jgi:hypothetical protein
VYALVGASGPVLLRGGRIDGPGTLMFAAPPARLYDIGEAMTSAAGVTATSYAAALSSGAIQQDGSTAAVFYLCPSTGGCYAMQADGDAFSDVVTFVATPT